MNEGQPAILVVDDDPDVVSGLRRLLSLDSYDVEVAGSIAEMLNRADWSRYFAILLDRKLSDGYAEEILPSLKELAPDAAVIVITGHSDLQSTLASFRAGAEDYLLKPIDPEMLRNRLGRIIEFRRAREALQHEETERKRAEEALRKNESQLRAILNTAADAIISIDRSGIITGVNPATERMFGFTQDELIGQNVNVLMPPPYRDEHDGYLRRYRETGEAHIIGIGRELAGRRKDGSAFPVDLAVSDTNQHGFTGMIRDISDRKELQKHVLEIAAEEQRRIGYELHDGTQQELTALALFADTLLATLSAATCIEEAGKTNWRLADADYLRLRHTAARLSLGLAEAHRHVHELSHAIMPVQIDAEGLRSALEALAAATNEQQNLTCHFECSGSVAVPNNSTATHLYRIAQEALHNAVRHGRASEVRISLARSETGIILEVSDNGIGFDPVASRRAASAGGGMGLRIMEYRAGMIGGMIHIDCRPEGGVLVRCTALSGESLR